MNLRENTISVQWTVVFNVKSLVARFRSEATQGREGGGAIVDQCYGPDKPPIWKEQMLSPPLDKFLRVRPWSGYTLFISYTILSQRLNEEADWNVCMCNLEEHNQIFIDFFYTEHHTARG